MPYILKSESFEVVDGPYKGKKYERGKSYVDIPPQEKAKFTEVPKPEIAAPAKEAFKPRSEGGKKNAGSDDNLTTPVKGAKKED